MAIARRMRPFGVALVCCLLSLGALDAARAIEPAVPMPPRRPATLTTPPAPSIVAPIPVPPLPPSADATELAACDRLFQDGTVVAQREPPVAGDLPGCGVAVPVKVSAIRLVKGGSVALEPPALLRCEFAAGFAAWVRDDLAGLLAQRNGGLSKLVGINGYQCRGRNRVVGAKLSEHGSGNAVDIRAFVLADGTVADITKVAQDETLFAQVKITTCARFMTVLGPGSDGYHEDNLHLDLEARRNGAHFCRWRLP